jgi:hypothetical protein|tara:strand:- start:42 stop:497 length:456 start_codon:yes stop_codon:yes gene_type:complete
MRSDLLNKNSGSYGESAQKVISWASGALTVSANDSGATYDLDTELGASATATLPAPQAGLHYRFFWSIAHDAAYERIINTSGSSVLYKGQVFFQDSAATTIADVQANGSSNYILTVNDDVEPGSYVDVVCNGLHWLVSGVICATATHAFSG